MVPDQAATTKFWSDLWDSPVEHNQKATWTHDVKSEFGEHKMKDFTITTEMIKNHAKKMQNWTAPGRDEVHGYWLKHIPMLHERLAIQLNDLLVKSNVPHWLTEGRTSLLMKARRRDTSKQLQTNYLSTHNIQAADKNNSKCHARTAGATWTAV